MPSASVPADVVGTILAGTPRIRLHLGSPVALNLDDVVVDTGFGGALRVPEGFFDQHGIPMSGLEPVALADGSLKHCLGAFLDVHWMGECRTVMAIEFGPEALLGMELLDHVRIDLIDDQVSLARI